MEENLLRPKDGRPTKCLECGLEPLPQGSIHSHLRDHHDMTVAQYREKHNIPGRSDIGRSAAADSLRGKTAHNRKYANLKTVVRCYICSAEFEMDSRQYHHRLRQGKTRFACPTPEGQKSSECRRKLQAITIKEVRRTKESRELTSSKAREMWARPGFKENNIEAMKAGMASSEAYAGRIESAAVTRAERKKSNPLFYSDAMVRAWDVRGRPDKSRVEFDCGTCGKHVVWNLRPSKFERFESISQHYCSSICQMTRNSGLVLAEMDVRNCLLCSVEVVRPKAYFDSHPNFRGFYCCSEHQRKFLTLYGLPESAIQKIKEFRSTQIFAERPNKKEQMLIPVLAPLGFKYCGNGTFRVDRLNPDFVNEETRVCVEHYGDWWHRNPKVYPGRENEIQLTARFSYRDSVYRSAGYKHVYMWENEMEDPSWPILLLARLAAAGVAPTVK